MAATLSAHRSHAVGAPDPIPEWAKRPFSICKKRLEDEIEFLHLTRQGLMGLSHRPKLIEILAKGQTADSDEARERAERLERSKRDAAWVTREAERGFPILHAHSVVGIWSALEVLSEDFALAWLANVPAAWEVDEIAKLKLPIGKYHQSSEDERCRWVLAEVSRAQSTDLRRGVGKLSSVLSVFALAPIIGPNARRALHEMCEIRNVLAHCGGVVDARLLRECPWLRLRVGDSVRITHEVYGWYVHAARVFSERVYNQLLVALKLPSCHCPGVDEIRSRPDEEAHEPAT